ncbi:MAG: thiol reductant ABC exporter subunit CydC [Acidimicrobiales bacterium]
MNGSPGALSVAPARQLALMLTAGTLSAACGIGLLATSGWLITRASERPPVLSLSIAIGAVQAFSLGKGLARYAQRLWAHEISLRELERLRLALYDLLEARVPGVVRGGQGAALAGFVSDADLVAEGMAKRLTAGVDIAASILLGGLLAALVEPSLGVALVAGALAVVVAAWALARQARAAEARAAAARSEQAGFVMEAVRSARELVAYGREDLLQLRLEQVRKQAASVALSRATATGLARAGATVMSGAAVIAVVGTGLALHSAGRLSGVALAAVVLATLAVMDQCASLPAVLAGTFAAAAAGARTRQLAEQAPLAEEPAAAWPGPKEPGTAALEQATVDLPGRPKALEDVSLRLKPGGRVALVGPSGAGKSTAVHALLHFVTCSQGRATLGGVDVTRLSRSDIAALAGWVADETYLFGTSLRANLRLGQPSATDEDCYRVLARVGLAEWCRSLPDGLSTQLGEGGRPVSAGERQRLGLARALLAEPAALLLDEPTAHLDPRTSASVLAELLGAASGRSVLVVSHEPGVQDLVDEVVVLDAGRLSGRPR